MRRIKSFFHKHSVLLFSSALFFALPLSFPSLFILSWVAGIPFFAVLLEETEKGTFGASLKKGIFFGFFYHFFVYFWFLWLYPLSFAGFDEKTSLFVVLLAWFGISFFHGVLFVFPFLFCRLFSKFTKSRPFYLAAGIFGFLLAQRLQGVTQFAFPWIKVSLGQYRQTALIQSASLFGSEGLDLLILSVSALLSLALFVKGRKRVCAVGLALVFFFSNLAFGVLRLLGEEEEEGQVVTAIQGCILSGEKWSGTQSTLDTYLDLSLESVTAETDLLVWPESAVPANLCTNPSLQETYQDLSRSLGIPVLMGTFCKQEDLTTNSVVLVDENEISLPYSKRILVPFGERVPYRALLSRICPPLTKINMLSQDLAPGHTSALMEQNGHLLGSVICYESIFPHVVRESVSDGAEMLFILTNDSWYEDSPAVWQHLAHGVFRSVENHRSIVRCANSGVSAMIDPKGRILKELGPLERGSLTETVSFSQKNTLYSAVGNCVFPILGGILILWGFALVWKERKKANG